MTLEFSEAIMDNGEKLNYLKKELDNRINVLVKKRNDAKNRSFALKILTVCFAATITILLGLKINDDWTKLFQDIALGLGAVITVLNAIEAFYDHRSLWIRRTVTLANLYDLRADLSYAIAGVDEAKIDVKVLDRFKDRYVQILQEDLKAWLNLHQDFSSEVNQK
jgi:uncharacterized protein DUF4231